jgi:putative MFS transporter
MEAGMPMDHFMAIGMTLLPIGVGLATWAVMSNRPRLRSVPLRVVCQTSRLTRRQRFLTVAIFIAFVIDSTKTSTIAFALPGMKDEYHLSTQHASLLPLVALTGTTIGSFVWGALADRLGRRSTLELATVLFMATSVCGTMPSFNGNLVMCFFMGIAAGGMVPIVYALLVETLPERRRGTLAVLLTTIGLGSGFGIIALVAQTLSPTFSWRILWLISLPTTLILLLIARWVPESPGWLMRAGRPAQARRIMELYGMTTVPVSPEHTPGRSDGMRGLLDPALRGRSALVAAAGLTWGLVNYGYLTLLPTFIHDQAISASRARALLAIGVLLSVPLSTTATAAYRWLSPKTGIAVYAVLTGASLAVCDFVVHSSLIHHTLIVVAALSALYTAANGLSAMIGPYTAEIFPLRLRGSAGGLTAGSGKFGGIVGPPVIAAGVALGGSMLAVYPIAGLLIGAAVTVRRYGAVSAVEQPVEVTQEAA